MRKHMQQHMAPSRCWYLSTYKNYFIILFNTKKNIAFYEFQFTTFYAPEKWRPSSNVYSVPPQNMACILESSDGNIIQNRSLKQGHSMTKYTKPNNIEILNDGNPLQAHVTNNRKRWMRSNARKFYDGNWKSMHSISIFTHHHCHHHHRIAQSNCKFDHNKTHMYDP